MTDEIPEDEPFAPFARWFELAGKSEPLAEAMMLATATATAAVGARRAAEGRRRGRLCLLYQPGEPQGRGAHRQPARGAGFHWKSLGRQVRIEGEVAPVAAAEADAYFASRARDSQIGAWASDQSRPLASRDELEERFAEFARQYAGAGGAAAGQLVRFSRAPGPVRILAGTAVSAA